MYQEEESKSEIYVSTYPYRPPVGKTPSNDIPLVIERSDEFPAWWVMTRTVTGDVAG